MQERYRSARAWWVATFVAQPTLKQLIKTGSPVMGAQVIVLGLTFKENCPDVRSSKVADLVRELQEFGCEVSVHDPIAEPDEAAREYGVALTPWAQLPVEVDAVVAAVPHSDYLAMPLRELLAKLKSGGVFIDVKSAFDRAAIGTAGFRMWRL